MANHIMQRDPDGLSPVRRRQSVPSPQELLDFARLPEEESASHFAEYWATLNRHRTTIILSAFGGLAFFLLIGVGTLPVYRARTSLEIQGLNSDFMNMRSVAATEDNGAAAADTNMQTQIRLLQSETLLHRTINRLEHDTHPQVIERHDLLSRAEQALHIGHPAPLSYNAVVEDASTKVKVKALGMTRLVEVTCDSWDPEFSAKFCNTLTQEFEDEDVETRTTEANKTSNWLTNQVAELRLKTEDSERRLEAATHGNGLILSQQSSTVGEERLRELQGELVKAQADRMEKEAEANMPRGTSIDTLPNVLDNPTYRAYQAKLADLRGQVAQLVPPLTEDNPKIIHLRAQIRDAEAGLAASRVTSTGRQKNELDAARHREDLLAVAYKAQESNVSSDLQKASQVSLLRREVESGQNLYQTLLQRAKEAGFASALQASTIRVVDTAIKPRIPVTPQRKTAAGAGFALGAFFSVGFALFKDRNTKVFRGPGEIERFLHVHELGVIPAATKQPKIDRGGGSVTSITASAALQSKALSIARWDDTFSLVAEAYRNATFSILLSDASKRARIYVVTSPSAGEGKTTVTSNLGVALSKSKLRVILVDGDLRKPNLHNAFLLQNDFGLRNILRGEVALDTAPVASYAKRTSLANLSVITSGSGNEDVVELLHSAHMSDLLARLSHDFDVILIDTPPTLHMADARIFAGQSDGAILVVRASSTSRDQAIAARDLLDHDAVRLIGTILNDFNPVSQGYKGYYESYHRYQDVNKVAS